jgi:hypothetical protein
MLLRAKIIWMGIGLLYAVGGINNVSIVSSANRGSALIVGTAPIKVTAQSAQTSLGTAASLRAVSVGF